MKQPDLTYASNSTKRTYSETSLQRWGKLGKNLKISGEIVMRHRQQVGNKPNNLRDLDDTAVSPIVKRGCHCIPKSPVSVISDCHMIFQMHGMAMVDTEHLDYQTPLRKTLLTVHFVCFSSTRYGSRTPSASLLCFSSVFG